MNNAEQRLRAALVAALPVLEEHATDERAFWGADDKHGFAAEAEGVYEQAKAALVSNKQVSNAPQSVPPTL